MIDEKSLIENMWMQFNSTYNSAHRYTEEESEMARRVLQDIESIIDELLKHDLWIPVEVDLPEIHNHVLITYKDSKGRIKAVQGYISVYDRKWHTARGHIVGKVIAWMPIPEAYKGEADEI